MLQQTSPQTISPLVVPAEFRHMDQIAGALSKDETKAVLHLQEPGHAHTIWVGVNGYVILETCDEDVADHSAFCLTASAYREARRLLDAFVPAVDPLMLAAQAVGLAPYLAELNFGFSLRWSEGQLEWSTFLVDERGSYISAAELEAEEG